MQTVVAILGRPNVGKSTLFNRLVGKKLALVDDQPGVTRDRRYAPASLAGLEFQVIDTAGMEQSAAGALTARMLEQTKEAIAEAHVLLFVIDARTGVTPADEHFAQVIRQSGKPVILAANKAEGKAGKDILGEAYALGFETLVTISAEHNEGMGDLYDALAPLVETAETEDEDKPLQLVVMGRPNAGKSTLINALLGEERLLTGPEAGITRDSIAVGFEKDGVAYKLVDTAGMRKRANVTGKLEKLAVSDAIRAMTYAEVVVLLLDATAPMEKQDATLGSLIESEGRAVVIGLNKADLIKGDKVAFMEEMRYLLAKQLPQLAGVEIVPVSAAKKTGLDKLLKACVKARETWNTRVSTAELNRWLDGTMAHHSPPLVRGRRLKIKYITQIKSRPPTFHLFCNMAKEFPGAYLGYLVRGLRETFDLEGTPVRLVLKESDNPFDKGRRKNKMKKQKEKLAK